MPPRRGNGPEHTSARRQAQEAAVRGLVAYEPRPDSVHDPLHRREQRRGPRPVQGADCRGGSLAEESPRAARRVVLGSSVRLVRLRHRVRLYGHRMEWRTSIRSGWPLSMEDTLQLTGAGSAMSLHSSAPALLHALRTRCPGDATAYLNQARATYPGGVSELDAALHLLYPPDEELEVGEITVFVEGAGEGPIRPRPTSPVYDCTRTTPPYAVMCEAFPREPTWCPALPPATHAPHGWASPHLPPPLSRTRDSQHRGQVLWQEGPGTPLLLLVVTTRGDPERVLGITPTHLYGAEPVPRPPLPAPAARDGVHAFLRAQEVTAVLGGPPSEAPPGVSRRPPGAQSPEPCPRLGAVARFVGRVAHPPPAPVPMDDHRPKPAWGQHHRRPPLPSPPSPRAALHGTAHGAPLLH